MKLPAFLRDARLWWVAGGAAVFTSLVVLFGAPPGKRRKPAGSVVDGWEVLEGPAVMLEKGARYRAVIDVPGVVPNGLVVSGIRDKAPLEGFRDVVVTDERPAAWHRDPSVDSVDADLFVEATYAGEPRPFGRPGAVVLAWREVVV